MTPMTMAPSMAVMDAMAGDVMLARNLADAAMQTRPRQRRAGLVGRARNVVHLSGGTLCRIHRERGGVDRHARGGLTRQT
jgi:hypothetical protein